MTISYRSCTSTRSAPPSGGPLMEEGPYGGMAGQQLVVAAGERLPHPAQLLPSAGGPPGGAVTSLRSHMIGDPLAGSACPGIGSGPREVRQTALPAVLVGHLLGPASSCLLGEPVRCFTASDS